MADSPQTVGDLVRAYLAEQCSVLIDAEAALRERGPVIHATRVAARRLRSTLRTYDDLIDVARAGALDRRAHLVRRTAGRGAGPGGAGGAPAGRPGRAAAGAGGRCGGRGDPDRAHHPAQGGLGRRGRRAGRRPLPAAAGRAAPLAQRRPADQGGQGPRRGGQGVREAGHQEAGQAVGPGHRGPADRRSRRRSPAARRSQGGQAGSVRRRAGRSRAGQTGREDHRRPQGPAGRARRAPGQHRGRRVPPRRGDPVWAPRSGHNGFTYGLLFGLERARRAAVTDQLRPFLS